MALLVPTSQRPWLAIFNEFITHLRIDSKETTATDRRGSPLNLWGSQKMFLAEVADGLDRGIRDFYNLKARQEGISTVSLAIDIFWLAMHPGIPGCLVVDNDENREKFRLIIHRYIESFPRGFFGQSFGIVKGKDNKAFTHFTNGSTLDYLVAGKRKKATLGESRAYAHCHCTEVGNWGDPAGIASFQKTLAQVNPDRLFIWESPLALDVVIPTPRGWTTMGKIKEGNWLYDDSGKPCRVVGVSPVFINKRCYEIEFSNGEKIVASEEHKWKVVERRWATNPQWKEKVVETKDIEIENHRVQLSKPLEMEDIYLPIDPYLLGAWIGDGRTDNVVMTCGDDDIDEIRSAIQDRGYTVGPICKYDWRVGKFTVLGQRALFSRLKLLGHKHIPDVYLRASEAQRRELLAGLMDTDGHISEGFRCTFCSILPSLIDQVAELLSSLGIKYHRSKLSEQGNLRTFPSGRTYACSASERLVFSEHPEKKVFNLKRKADVHSARAGTGRTSFTWRKAKFLKIVAVREVSSVPTKCISVDSSSHLFLVGNTMIPTHNTAKGFNHWHDMYYEAKRDELTKKAFFIGWWAKELNSYSLKGPAPEPQLYREYGAEPPNREEQELIDKVLERHGVAITRGQLAWYRHETSSTSTSQEDQHQNIPWLEEQAFVLTGYSFFQTRNLQKDMARIQGLDEGTEPVEFKGYRFWVGNDFFSSKMEQVFRVEDVELRIWEEPSKHGDYVIGCDPAYGRSDEGDNTSISVWRCYADKLVQVAEYTMNKIDTRQAAWILAYLAGSFRNCIVNLELTGGVGMAVMTEFKNLRDQLQSPAHFQKVKDLEWEDFLNNARWFLYHRPDSLGAGYVNGFMTTRDRKFEIMNQLRDLHVTGTLVVNSLPLTQEMLIIVQDGGHLGAQGTNKDDRVFAAALAARSYIDWVRPRMLAANMTYDRVVAGEEGTQEGDPGVVDRMVADFFRRAEERASEGPEHPKWMVDRGLV